MSKSLHVQIPQRFLLLAHNYHRSSTCTCHKASLARVKNNNVSCTYRKASLACIRRLLLHESQGLSCTNHKACLARITRLRLHESQGFSCTCHKVSLARTTKLILHVLQSLCSVLALYIEYINCSGLSEMSKTPRAHAAN